MTRTTLARMVRIGLVMALMVVAFAVVGCAGQEATQQPAAETMPASTEAAGGMGEMPEMTCAMCNKGAPEPVAGTATMEDGVQVVTLMLEDGYYTPNEITIKADTPAKLIFKGEAKDCSGKPKIAALNMQADFTQTGEAVMDLGKVAPGTYPITCGMDSPGGNLIVE